MIEIAEQQEMKLQEEEKQASKTKREVVDLVGDRWAAGWLRRGGHDSEPTVTGG